VPGSLRRTVTVAAEALAASVEAVAEGAWVSAVGVLGPFYDGASLQGFDVSRAPSSMHPLPAAA